MGRGQISVEYLVVVGFIVFLIISVVAVAFFYTSGIKDRIRINQATDYANKIVSSAESVYYAGEPSKLTITAYLPVGVNEISVVENSIIISMTTNSGETTMAFSSNVPIDGNVSRGEGVKKIVVLAEEDRVYFNDF